ncbi:flagellar hook-length control protein FliK [Aeromonas eucrenophila]|uniref:Flagellar hook-length control protein FliK n=1 Tax=Aeromonas eucrenophila TaxID=649 RepID=A0ABW0YFP9_9GAMM|nr:flagellar hook-length control protein FliK [Aeromonas eucrenophila]
MIQTQLLKAAIQATPADNGTASAMLPMGNEGTELPLQDGGKAAFADAMARAQLVGKGAPAAQTGEQPPAAMTPDAKSLATDGTPASTPPTSDKSDETELPPDDFLQQLQASLRQDVSLVVPPAPLVAQTAQAAMPTAPVIDGNDLPPESQPVSPADAGKPAATTDAATPQTLLRPVAEGRGTGETLAQGAATPRGEAGKSDKGSELATGLGKGAQALPVDGQLAAPAAQSEAQVAQLEAQAATQVEHPEAVAPKPAPQPLSGQERAALLAKVSPAQTDAAPVAEASESPTAGKSAQSISTEHAAHGAQATPGAHGAQSTQGAQASAAKAFGEGLVRVDTQSDASANATPDGGKSGDESSQTRAAAEPEAKPGQTPAAKSETQAATQVAAGSGAPAGVDPEPVLTTAPQILARHESQGPQASLTALSAGIQQMEAEPAVAARVAVELKQTDMKSKLDEPGTPALETKSVEQSESTPAPQHAQAQPGESRPAAEVAARREAQTLPHLKLATPEAPEQLHQKVNLMLTDKLQQAELQLDPLGLGKMKIQIQMGADNQASVHFVVQHGQTREMLEQAMPRLRDMLAGQGIQLGQTQVQQQSQQQAQQGQQQQSQGQSTFNGQGQQGRQEGGSFGGSGQGKGEHGARAMSLLVESTNDSGIDFYA